MVVRRDAQTRALQNLRPAAQAGVAAGCIAVILLVDLAARAGLALPDPRPIFLVAVVAAAAFGGAGPATATGAATWLYCLYYFRPGGLADGSTLEIGFQTWTYLVYAPAAIVLVLLKRRRSRRLTVDALTAERGRADLMAADNAALSRAIIDSLPAHVAVLNAQGMIVSANNAWAEFAAENTASPEAADVAKAIGVNYLAVCRRATGANAMEGPAVAEGIADVLAGRKPTFRIEYPCHAPDRQRWFLLTVSPLRWTDASTEAGRGAAARRDDDGPVRGGVVVSHLDITDRKLAEQAVRARAAELAAVARDLKRTNAELDQFAYITSHDLRAPLRGIANLATWIEEDLAASVTPDTKKQLDLLRGRVSRMEGMIDGILQYSRVGRVHGDLGPVDVAELLEETIDLMAVPANFTVDVQGGLPVLVTERLRLQQVFMNLIGNAIKHHDQGRGTVRIGYRATADAELHEFTVADDGPGIEPQYHEKIFQIFQTLQPRDRVEGTGVGLALVRKTVETFGGTIAAESTPGERGTTFRFTWKAQAWTTDA